MEDSLLELNTLSFNDLLMLLIIDMSCIKNDLLWNIPELSKFHGIDCFFYAYLNWMNQPFVYTTYFEKLVGAKGGGSAEMQLEEIINIAKFLDINLSPKNAQLIADSLFGGTGTFHEGQIGSWKKYFKPEHKNAFKQLAGNLLIELGYEQDFNW